MNLIKRQLEKIKEEKRMGYMTHVIVGYPSLAETVSMVETMDKEGVDFVELQIPFSDPLADGPTIMKACEQSLEQGTKVSDSFLIAEKLSRSTSIPMLFMAYYNTVFKYGVEKFCKDAKKAGVSGLIVPDMSLEEEENEGFSRITSENDLFVTRVVSPASTEERLRKNSDQSMGFLYCTARQGITGNQKQLDPKVISYLKDVRRISNTPIAVGFGIKSKEDVMLIKKYADIVVVGSAIVTLASKSRGKKLQMEIKKFLSSIRV